MKKVMTMVASIIMIATANASNSNVNNVANEPHRLAPFSTVKVNVPARVKLVHGDDYGVMASTPYLADTTQLEYHVKDGVLYISTVSDEMLRASGRGTMITVITPNDDANIRIGEDVQAIRK